MSRLVRRVRAGEDLEVWFGGRLIARFCVDRNAGVSIERTTIEAELRWPGWTPPKVRAPGEEPRD